MNKKFLKFWKTLKIVFEVMTYVDLLITFLKYYAVLAATFAV